MKISPYSVNIHWDKRYPKANTNLCPLQLFVNLKTVQFKMGLKMYCTKEEFDKLNSKGGSADIKELRRKTEDYVRKAETILAKLPKPSRESFQRMFKSDSDIALSHKTDVGFLFEEYNQALIKEGRIKTASNLKQSLNSFHAYKEKLYFEDIDGDFLKGYKAWMLKKDCSATTVQIYMRNLRTIFNKAVRDGYISERFYPFKQYTIGGAAKSKSVLYPVQAKLLWNYEPKGIMETRAKDMWFFCYLLNGINFKDAVKLKYKNLNGDKIIIVREKTKRTNTIEGKQIVIFLHQEAMQIINKWGNKDKAKDNYIFPFLNNITDEVEKEKRFNTVKRKANMMLNKIGTKLELPVPLNLNLARHSFATRLKLDGTPLTFISDAMGHSNSKTTEHYLKSITDDSLKTMSSSLLNFK